MNKFLFRGKATDTGIWYEGYYMALSHTTYCFKGDYEKHPENTKHYIVFDQMTDWGLPNRHLQVEVDPATIGLYTGYADKNETKLFPGDILVGAEYPFTHKGKKNYYAVIIWEGDRFGLFTTKIPTSGVLGISEGAVYPMYSVYGDDTWDPALWEKVGNIHDNPDLIEAAALQDIMDMDKEN